MLGRMPWPSLPTDSAISCSTHKPKTRPRLGHRKLNLSRPARRLSYKNEASRIAGLSSESVEQMRSASAALSIKVCKGMPTKAAGTKPKTDKAE